MKNALTYMLLLATSSAVFAQGTRKVSEAVSPPTARINPSNPFSSLVGSDHYYTSLSTSYVHTTNAFSDFREIKDWYLNINASVGWRSTIGSSMYLDLSAFVNRFDYSNQELLSRNAYGTRVSLMGLLPGRFRLPYFLTYTGQWFTDSSYDSVGLNFHNVNVTVPTYRKSFGNSGTLTMLASFSWMKAEPSDFDQVIPGIIVRYNLPITDKDDLQFSLVQSYSYYRHFLPGQFMEGDRQDWRTSLTLQWVHNFTKNIAFTAGVSYLRNDSNLTGFDVATGRTGGIYDYKAWNFTPTIGVNFTF